MKTILKKEKELSFFEDVTAGTVIKYSDKIFIVNYENPKVTDLETGETFSLTKNTKIKVINGFFIETDLSLEEIMEKL